MLSNLIMSSAMLLTLVETAPPPPPEPTRLAKLFGTERVPASAVQPRRVGGYIIWSVEPPTQLEREMLVAADALCDTFFGRRAGGAGVIWLADSLKHYRVMLHRLTPEGNYLAGSTGIPAGRYSMIEDRVVAMRDYINRTPLPDEWFVPMVLSHEVAHHRQLRAIGSFPSRAISGENPLFSQGFGEYVMMQVMPPEQRQALLKRYLPAVESLLAEHPTTEAYHAAADDVKTDLYEHGHAIVATAMMFEEAEVRRILKQMVSSQDDYQEVVRLSKQINAMATHDRLTAWTKRVRQRWHE